MKKAEAIALIEAERARQLSEEGWTPEHDDQHDDGALLRVAVYYYQHTIHPIPMSAETGAPRGWAWDSKWWKPKDRTRNLVRAGALCMAERDRLRRRLLSRSSSLGPVQRRSRRYWPPHVRHKFDLIVSALCAA